MIGQVCVGISRLTIGLLVFGMTSYPDWSFADEPKAREIMQQVRDRDDGDNQTANVQMVLIDKRD